MKQAENKACRKNIIFIRCLLIAAAVAVIAVGVIMGEHSVVLQKAVSICFECIGI